MPGLETGTGALGSVSAPGVAPDSATLCERDGATGQAAHRASHSGSSQGDYGPATVTIYLYSLSCLNDKTIYFELCVTNSINMSTFKQRAWTFIMVTTMTGE